MSTAKPYSRWRPHPWHGLSSGPNPPRLVCAYIEITPFDPVKYEIDKDTGYLCVDRPQRSSSTPPTLYGFIPRTYCGKRVSALAKDAARGDGDPLDICVISERPISHSEVILNARVVGGLRTVDRGETDDKIIAVLEKDAFWGEVNRLADLPKGLVDRLRHYFSTYKLMPGEREPVQVLNTYEQAEAFKVVEAAMQDYEEEYGKMDEEEGGG